MFNTNYILFIFQAHDQTKKDYEEALSKLQVSLKFIN
jgi:hypothetical protein